MAKETLGDIWDSLPEVERKMASMVIAQQVPYELYEVYTDLNNRLMKLEGADEANMTNELKMIEVFGIDVLNDFKYYLTHVLTNQKVTEEFYKWLHEPYVKGEKK